jgi:hypothetical protein
LQHGEEVCGLAPHALWTSRSSSLQHSHGA